MKSEITKFPLSIYPHGMVAGVEIGPGSIRIVVLQCTKGVPTQCIKYHEEPFPENLAPSPSQISEFLQTAFQNLGIPLRKLQVWSNLYQGNARLYPLQIPVVQTNHLVETVFWAIQKEDPFDEKKYLCDVLPERNPQNGPPHHIKALGFLVPLDEQRRITEIFLRAGIPLAGVTLSLFSVRNLFHSGWLSFSGDILAYSHIGWNSTRLSIEDQSGTLLSRSIPVGLEPLAEDLVHSLSPKVSMDTARRMVAHLGKEDWPYEQHSLENIFSALEPALTRMARQIDRTIEYFRTHFNNLPLPSVIYISGFITECPHCLNHLQQETNFPTTVPELHPGPKENTPPLPPSLNTAFGLALASENINPNFANPLAKRLHAASHRVLSQRVFFLFLILTFLLGILYFQQYSTVRGLEQDYHELSEKSPTQVMSPVQWLERLAEWQQEFQRERQTLRSYIAPTLVQSILENVPEGITLHQVSAHLIPASEDDPPHIRLEGILQTDPSQYNSLMSVFRLQLLQSPFFNEFQLRREIDRSTPFPHREFSAQIILEESYLP